MFFEGREALDYIARQAQRISKEVRSTDAEYVDAVNRWCSTILKVCKQGLDVASDKLLRPEVLGDCADVINTSSPDAARRVCFGLFHRKRAISHPLPKAPLEKPEEHSGLIGATSCPSSLIVDRRSSFFGFIKKRSGSHPLLSFPLSQEPLSKKALSTDSLKVT